MVLRTGSYPMLRIHHETKFEHPFDTLLDNAFYPTTQRDFTVNIPDQNEIGACTTGSALEATRQN